MAHVSIKLLVDNWGCVIRMTAKNSLYAREKAYSGAEDIKIRRRRTG
jgi:hypothetical protein